MYSSTSFNASTSGMNQDGRSFYQSYSHPGHSQPSPFTVAGMSNPNVNSPGLRSNTIGGNNMSMGMGDGLSQSRSHYQPGYLMSVTQNHTSPSQNNQRHEEVLPVVQTKAKMNQILAGGSVSDFGMDSMFESSRQRQRQALADEDAPPTSSVNDIVNEISADMTSRFQNRTAVESPRFRPSQSQFSLPSTPKPATPPSAQPLYIIVFGYPPDKYSVTAEYFKALGASTEPDPHAEISNCFRIGFASAAAALRAMRKNGEIVGGGWMIGTKWADPAQAEAVLGMSLTRGPILGIQSPELGASTPDSPDVHMDASPTLSEQSALVLVSQRATTPTPTVGTPLRLAPSTAAFRKATVGAPKTSGTHPPPVSAPQLSTQDSPNKGMFGQVSDLIFGW